MVGGRKHRLRSSCWRKTGRRAAASTHGEQLRHDRARERRDGGESDEGDPDPEGGGVAGGHLPGVRADLSVQRRHRRDEVGLKSYIIDIKNKSKKTIELIEYYEKLKNLEIQNKEDKFLEKKENKKINKKKYNKKRYYKKTK